MNTPEVETTVAGRGAPNTETARFTAVVARAGKPKVYLPLFDPKKDRAFMRAVKESRVLSIRQEPTAKSKDFAVVGFDEQHHNTYLVFPKPLTAFKDARVIGIKYDVLGDSSPVTGKAPPSLKLPKTRPEKSRITTPASRVPVVAAQREQKPEPPKRVEPQPKEFRVRVRVTTVAEKDVTVKALTKTEAKEKAQAAVENEGAVRAVSVSEV
ncbi:MAG TPA: hypothetical protein VNT99_07850 [Methylomirabilota bacterium]|nr:hypothetical protein [Methylomirabilota bacterium]